MKVSIHQQQQAMDRLDLAKAACESGQYDRALSHIRRAVELDPQNVNARVLQARVYLKQNRPNLAMSALSAQETIAPQLTDSPEVAMLRAEALGASGFDRIARKQLRELAERLPDDVRPYRMLSGLYLKLNEFNGAVDALREVVRLSPSDQASGRLLADLLQQRDPQSGLDMLLSGKADAAEPGVLLRAARQCRELDRLRDADELYHAILKHRPDDAGVLLEAGVLADELGEDGIAQRRLSTALKIQGEHHAEAYDALGRVHSHAGRFGQAALCAWKSARLAPHNAAPWAFLAVYARAAGRNRLADRVLVILNRYTASRQRQQLLAEAWQHAAAAMTLDSALGELPPDHAGQSTLKSLLKQAAHSLDKVARDYPQRADAQYHLAVCHHLLDDPTAANLHNDQALAINPRYESALRLAEQIEVRIQNC